MASSSRKKSAIGPKLPPEFNQSNTFSNDCETIIGPALPPNVVRTTETYKSDFIGPSFPEKSKEGTELDNVLIGPALPPGFEKKFDTISEVIGPALPSSMKPNPVSESVGAIGPALPPHMRRDGIGSSAPRCGKSSRSIIGPVLPNTCLTDSDSSSDDDIGPKLHEAADAETQNTCTASADFERRAEKMKNKILYKDSDVKKREEWMTELPSRLGPQIGMGARSFRKQAYVGKEDDRSEWTDTPADRKRKAEVGDIEDQGPSAADIALHRRNEEISSNLDAYNKSKRKESLLDLHKKKRKKEKKNQKVKEERREFDRDKDLNIQNVDAKQAKSFIDKARLFGGKFSHGASHFL